jgi:hypothetical protein
MTKIAPSAIPFRYCAGIVVLCCALTAICGNALASSPCGLGLRNGSAITLDGRRMGAEWTDASQIDSDSPCFNDLLDADGLEKKVVVYAKKFTRNGQTYFGFFFEVLDGSSSGLLNGERIVLQFDPNKNSGAQLELGATAFAKDWQIVITHLWQSSSGDPGLVSGVDVKVFDGSLPSGVCPLPRWNDVTGTITPLPGAVVRKDTLPGGYTVEIEAPLAMLGDPPGDVGLAFAVINDFGTCNSGVCDGYGASFPSTLPVTNADNPVIGCRDSWVVPDNFGVGYVDSPPGDVTILRTPEWWNSQDIDVFRCSVSGAVGYEYFPTTPCKLQIQATLHAVGGTQTRNIVFLWADHGSSPNTWRFIDLREGVTVSGSGTVDSAVWDAVPPNLQNHPCLRVYILPPDFRAAFDRTRIQTISNPADVTLMESTYNLGANHWAQKNINRRTDVTVCPSADQSCHIITMNDRRRERDFTVASVSPILTNNLFDPADAQSRTATTGASRGERPPVIRQTGNQTLLSDKEKKIFLPENVVVQVRAYGYSLASGGPPRYNFIENLGGVLQIIPEALLRRNQEIQFVMNVTNPGAVERTIFLRVDTQVPTSLEGRVRFALDTRAQKFAPGETRVIRGDVILGTGGGGPGGGGSTGELDRFSVSLRGGVSIPHGAFRQLSDVGANFAAGFEARATEAVSAEAIFGYHKFFIAGPGPDLSLYQVSGNLKVYTPDAAVRFFANAGPGVYKFDPGPTDVGANFGGGIQFNVSSRFAVEGAYNFHIVNTAGTRAKFSTLQGGFRYWF